MVAVMVCGNPQRAHPAPAETVSQSPPLAVSESNRKLGPSPGLVMVKVCGSGSAPLNCLVKLIALTWLKTFGPTTTLTGTVTLLAAAWNRSCPIKVPAVSPPPGNFCGDSVTLTVAGAAPLAAERLSQPPPSEVLLVSVKLSVPDPAFLTC